jgi:hypothetical protein
VGAFAKILTGEIPLIAKDKAANPFYLYVPAFNLADLDTLTTRGLRLCRTQPIMQLSSDEIKPQAEAILPESEALELARFYWAIIRSRYKYLNVPLHDFKTENVGSGELVWLTMSNPASVDKLSGKEQATFHA